MPVCFINLINMEIILIVVLGLVLIFAYGVYVSIVRKRNKVQEAYSGIDVQLTKRHDLIPNVLSVAKNFMKHEKSLFTDITALRTQAVKQQHPKDAKSVKKALETEMDLGAKLNQLMVNVENYPNLKSDQTMVNAQKSLENVEEHIAASRRFYNSSVRVLNDTIQIWPMSMIASFVKVEPYPFFEADKEAEEVPDASALLG